MITHCGSEARWLRTRSAPGRLGDHRKTAESGDPSLELWFWRTRWGGRSGEVGEPRPPSPRRGRDTRIMWTTGADATILTPGMLRPIGRLDVTFRQKGHGCALYVGRLAGRPGAVGRQRRGVSRLINSRFHHAEINLCGVAHLPTRTARQHRRYRALLPPSCLAELQVGGMSPLEAAQTAPVTHAGRRHLLSRSPLARRTAGATRGHRLRRSTPAVETFALSAQQ
jgi:hypothetical protein